MPENTADIGTKSISIEFANARAIVVLPQPGGPHKIKFDNFLSYGENNFFDFTKLNGMVLLNGEPANQSGKTTFALHAIAEVQKNGGRAADVLYRIGLLLS